METINEIEQAGKRVHLLLYSNEESAKPEFVEWRNDLESAISDWIDAHKKLAVEEKMKSLSETYENHSARCIATDAEYSNKEMAEILSNALKSDYEFVSKLLNPSQSQSPSRD